MVTPCMFYFTPLTTLLTRQFRCYNFKKFQDLKIFCQAIKCNISKIFIFSSSYMHVDLPCLC